MHIFSAPMKVVADVSSVNSTFEIGNGLEGLKQTQQRLQP